MYNPMLIDEINEHTTAAVGGIDLSPVQNAVEENMSNLLINGYREGIVKTDGFSGIGWRDLLSITGEGYIDEFLLVSGNGQPELILDGKTIFKANSMIYPDMTSPFGFTLKDYLWQAGVVNEIMCHALYEYMSIYGKSADSPPNTFMKEQLFTGGNVKNAFMIIPAPIKFKQSLKIRYYASTEYCRGIIHYWVKTS